MKSSSLGGHSEFRPSAASEVDIIGFIAALIGHFGCKADGVHRADLDTGLRAPGTAFFFQVGCVHTQVAFLGLLQIGIPLNAARCVRTADKTHFASDAKCGVDHANVALFGVRLVGLYGSYGANRHTGSILALTANGHRHVIRPVCK